MHIHLLLIVYKLYNSYKSSNSKTGPPSKYNRNETIAVLPVGVYYIVQSKSQTIRVVEHGLLLPQTQKISTCIFSAQASYQKIVCISVSFHSMN